MSIWEKFENIVSPEEMEQFSKKKFEKPKAGEHDVELLAVEATESSNGLPLVKFTFKDIKNRQFINCTMFLTNQFYPERNAQEMGRVLAVLYKLGNSIEYVNMTQLERDINSTEVGGTYKINLTYRNETTKYPNFEILERLTSPETPKCEDGYFPVEDVDDSDLPF